MRKRYFGIQLKLVALLLIVCAFLVAAGIIAFLELSRIQGRATVITDQEAPIVESIEQGLTAMLSSSADAETALDVDDPSQEGTIDQRMSAFDAANTRFKMFMAAITWGSETDAFKQSDDGVNYKAWVAAHLPDTLAVQQASPVEAGLAAQASIYYAGFVNNTEKAVELRKTYLADLASGSATAAAQAKNDSKSAQNKARAFLGLVTDNLNHVVEISSGLTTQYAGDLTTTQASVKRELLYTSVIGFLFAILISLFFARRVIVSPIQKLTTVAEAVGMGDFSKRARIESWDEFGVLGTAFNEMAARIQRSTKDLEAMVATRTGELNVKVQELGLANERLRELDKLKTEFLSVAAHQLRTPLSAIKWILGILLDGGEGELTPAQKSLLYKGFESNERMINLINDMLAVTRIDAGKERYTMVPLHIEDIIDNLIIDFAGQAHVRHMTLTFERPASKLPYIVADGEKIRSVLQNLIENAMHYTPDGGSIVVRANRESGTVIVSVKDSGIGIPKSQQANIFGKFFRADNAVKHQTDGSGLGLYIAKNIVEKHSGSIRFSSEEGKGSSFTIALPISTASSAIAPAGSTLKAT